MSDNIAIRMLDRQVVTPDAFGEAVDLGSMNTIGAQIRVLDPGSAGSIELQHSAVNEESSFVVLGSGVNLNTVSNDVQTHSSFLRYVRWGSDSNVAGSPVVQIDIIAKES